jgi:hypothetical protein
MMRAYRFEVSAYDLSVLVKRLKPIVDPDSPMFHSLCLRTDVDMLRGYATDGYRWACQEVEYRTKPKGPPDELVLPVSALAACLEGISATKLKHLSVTISVRAKTCRLRTDYHSVYVAREDSGGFPDFDGLKPLGNEGAARLSINAGLIQELGRAVKVDGETTVHLEFADPMGHKPVPFATALGTFYGGLMPVFADDDFRVKQLAKATVR